MNKYKAILALAAAIAACADVSAATSSESTVASQYVQLRITVEQGGKKTYAYTQSGRIGQPMHANFLRETRLSTACKDGKLKASDIQTGLTSTTTAFAPNPDGSVVVKVEVSASELESISQFKSGDCTIDLPNTKQFATGAGGTVALGAPLELPFDDGKVDGKLTVELVK